MIVEVQTTGSNNATNDEFVEIYNQSAQTIDISSWKLQYLSAGGTSWQTKATLNGWLYPNGRLLLASKDYLADVADIAFNPGFKLEAGHIRLVSPDPSDDSQLIEQDLVGWGTAVYPEGQSATAPPAGASLQRNTSSGKYTDTDNNALDLSISLIPNPESLNVEPEVESAQDPVLPPEPTADEQPAAITETVTEDENNGLLPVIVSELLPNPAAPASDSADEYIELYNPNDQEFDLADYKLQTGSAYSYSFTLDTTALPPHAYLVLYVNETGLTLANTSGRARLLSPNGDLLFETSSYEDAPEGQAWTFVDNVWQWTTVPTPASANILVAPQNPATLATSQTTTPKKTTTTTAKKVTKPKAKVATKKQTPKKTTTKEKTNKDGEVAGSTSGNDDSSPPTHMWIIALVGCLAVGYAAYEYRHDVASKIEQWKRNRTTRRASGAAT